MIVIWILRKKQKENTWKKHKWNELYSEVKKNLGSRIFYIIFLLRRFILIITPFITDSVVAQINLAVYTALLCTCYLVAVKPLKNPKDQQRESNNDIILLFAHYCCFGFVDIYTDEVFFIAGSSFKYIL